MLNYVKHWAQILGLQHVVNVYSHCYYLLCEVWLLLFPFKRQRNWGSGRWSCLFKATQWVSSGAETWGHLWLGSCLFAMCHEASLWEGKVCVLVTQSCPALCDPMDCRLLGFSVHGILQARLPGVGGGGYHSLLQGIFPTQGLNPGVLSCRWILYCLSHQGSPGKGGSVLIREKREREREVEIEGCFWSGSHTVLFLLYAASWFQ